MSEPPPWVPPYGYAPPPEPPRDPLISPDYSGWWERGTAVVRTSWRQLALLQGIAAVILFGLQGSAAVAEAFAERDLVRLVDDTSDAGFGTILTGYGLTVGASLLAALVSVVATLAAVRLVVEAATGGQPTIPECLRFAASRLARMIGWSLLAGLIVLVGVCACVLPGIYLGAVFTVLAPVVALERTGAIARCFRLFHGDLGSAVARIATILGLTVGAGVVAAIPEVIGGLVADPGTASVPAFVTAALVGSAVAVLLGCAVRIVTDPLTVTAYADMRARIEPLNSTILAHEAAA